MKTIIYIFLFLLPSLSIGQTFSGTTGEIPTDGSVVEFEVVVSGLPSSINSDFGLESFCFTAPHQWMADINMRLITPSGVSILLVNGVGGDQDGFENTCLNSNSSNSLFQGVFPYSGTFKPLGQLGNVNNGQNPNGIWKIQVFDTYAFADDGSIAEWSISFGNQPSLPFNFKGTDLPIIQFLTSGQTIQDEPDVLITMKVYDNGVLNFPNDPNPIFEGFANVEHRGQSSQGFPKKSYGLETCTISGEDTSVVLLDFPSESDFVLHASYSDKTLMRNVLAHNIYNEMGHYSSRSRYVVLFENDEYQGIFALFEKIKRDKDRVNVDRLTQSDTLGTDLTGGYIFKVDKGDDGGWVSARESIVAGTACYYQYVYPQLNDILDVQKNYIRSYVDSLEESLYSHDFINSYGYHYSHYLDTESFIDNMIINEISKNIDAYRLSSYFHKKNDEDGGKIFAGPLWDFDLSFRNAGFCTGENPEGWIWNQYCDYQFFPPPMFLYKLMEDPAFMKSLQCRWRELRDGPLALDSLYADIDAWSVELEKSLDSNFEIWPILGVGVWPNPEPIAATYPEEISQLKNWLAIRMQWLDTNWPHFDISCQTTSVQNKKIQEYSLFPNPVSSELTLKTSTSANQDLEVSIIDMLSIPQKTVFVRNGSNLIFNTNSLLPGQYYVKVINRDEITVLPFIKL